jgi:SPX domain protein involved in polyphosphate accumulation
MKKLHTTKTTESELLQARKEGLERARSLDSMRAHGKWRGMDVFSWANPHFEALSTAIASFPFPVVWIGKHEQIKCACTYYPEVLDTMETAIVYDQANLKLKPSAIDNLEKVAGVGSLDAALKLVQSLEKQRRVFLFTTEGNEVVKDINEFNDFVNSWD